MKILSRDFTLKEKILLGLLVVIILGFCYYQFLDQPVRDSIARSEAQKASLEIELTSVQTKIAQLEKMKTEIDKIIADGSIAPMPSYNNNKEVNLLLNEVFGPYNYYLVFSDLTRDGNQIRRAIKIEFVPRDYETMEAAFAQLEKSKFRCLVDNVQYSKTTDTRGDSLYFASAVVTFYETMVGGTPDSGLPADKSE